MRRSDIIKSITNILDAVELVNIQPVIKDLLRRDSKDDSMAKLISAANRFSILYSSFTEEEKSIVSIFDLDILINIEELATIILSDNPEKRSTLWALDESIIFLKSYLPKTLDLFKQSHQDLYLQKNDENGDRVSDKLLLTLILPEKEGESSSPERLKESLEAIMLIYKVCAEINDLPSHDISVVGIDSGSDKSFDFLGNAKVIECVKDFFFLLWDRIVFYREKKLEQKLELIAKSLPLIEKISQLEKDGVMGKEQAGIYKRDIDDGVNKLLKTGAIIPEVEYNSNYNVRELMAPEAKMLMENTESDPSKQQPLNKKESSGLSQEEEEVYNRLLEKKKSNRSQEE